MQDEETLGRKNSLCSLAMGIAARKMALLYDRNTPFRV